MGNMRLCFGTFASLLNKYRNKGLRQSDFISYLIAGIDENSRYRSEEPAITRLLHCKMEYVLTPIANENKPSHDVLQDYISKIIAHKIKEDGKKMILLTLLDIIRKDKSLDNDNSNSELFKDYFGIYKEQLLRESKLVFSDIISKALLYTTYGVVENTYGKGVAPKINDEYITAATSAYLNDIEWDKGTQTLTLKYIEYCRTFIEVVNEYNMYFFITSVDPLNGIDGSWFDKYSEFREKCSTDEKYKVTDKSEMGKKIMLFCKKLDEYIAFLPINMSINSCEKTILIPSNSCEKGYVSNHSINILHEEFNEKVISTKDFCKPGPDNIHAFYHVTTAKRSELNSIYGEILQYAFPHFFY